MGNTKAKFATEENIFKEETEAEQSLRLKTEKLCETFSPEEDFTPEEALIAICLEAQEKGNDFKASELQSLLQVIGMGEYWDAALAVGDDIFSETAAGHHPTDLEMSEDDPEVQELDDLEEPDFLVEAFESTGEVDFDSQGES